MAMGSQTPGRRHETLPLNCRGATARADGIADGKPGYQLALMGVEAQ